MFLHISFGLLITIIITGQLVFVNAECPTGWIEKLETCYLNVGPPLDHSAAVATCAKAHSGAGLPMFRDKTDMDNFLFVVDMYDFVSRVWIAGGDAAEGGVYKTYDPKTNYECGLRYLPWAEGQPDDSGGNAQSCLTFNDSRVDDISCDTNSHVICQIRQFDYCACPFGWDRVLNTCYKSIQSSLLKSGAATRCSQEYPGAALPRFRDNVEFAAFISYIAATPNVLLNQDHVWIDGKYAKKKGIYMINDDVTGYTCEVKFFVWHSGQPVDVDNIQKCLSVGRNQTGMSDVSCKKKLEFVCQLRDEDYCDCPYSWSHTIGGCYKYMGAIGQQAHATATCSSMQAYLPMFRDGLDWQAFIDFLHAVPLGDGHNNGDFVWLFGDDLEVEGEWVITNPPGGGSGAYRYLDWYPGQPNDAYWGVKNDGWAGKGSDCMGRATFQFNDAPCNRPEYSTVCHLPDYEYFATCPPLSVANGSVQYNDVQLFVRTSATVTCSYGFHLHGPLTLVCLTDKTWGDVLPTCEVCPQGWTAVEGPLCYRHIGNMGSAQHSATACASEHPNSTLPIIKNSDEQNSLVQFAQSLQVSTSYFWLEGSDAAAEGAFFIHDTRFDLICKLRFASWLPGEPNDVSGSQDCIAADLIESGGWDDQECSDISRGTICQIRSSHQCDTTATVMIVLMKTTFKTTTILTTTTTIAVTHFMITTTTTTTLVTTTTTMTTTLMPTTISTMTTIMMTMFTTTTTLMTITISTMTTLMTTTITNTTALMKTPTMTTTPLTNTTTTITTLTTKTTSMINIITATNTTTRSMMTQTTATVTTTLMTTPTEEAMTTALMAFTSMNESSNSIVKLTTGASSVSTKTASVSTKSISDAYFGFQNYSFATAAILDATKMSASTNIDTNNVKLLAEQTRTSTLNTLTKSNVDITVIDKSIQSIISQFTSPQSITSGSASQDSVSSVRSKSEPNLNYNIGNSIPKEAVKVPNTTNEDIWKKKLWIWKEVLQALGCSWLIGCLVFLIASFGVFRIFHLTRLLQMNQEISLLIAHIIILFSRWQMNKDVCRVVCGVLHYVFLVHGSFLALEAVHGYSVASNGVNAKGLMSRFGYVALGWGLPAIVTFVSAPLIYYAPSTHSCWFNYGNQNVIVGLGGTILTTRMIALVAGESIWMIDVAGLPMGSPADRLTAMLSGLSLLIVVPLGVFSWTIGSLALYHNNIALFGLVFISNVSLGVAFVKTRMIISPEVRGLVHRIGSALFHPLKLIFQRNRK